MTPASTSPASAPRPGPRNRPWMISISTVWTRAAITTQPIGKRERGASTRPAAQTVRANTTTWAILFGQGEHDHVGDLVCSRDAGTGDAGDARQVEPQVEHQGDAQHEQPQGHGSPRMSDLIREAGQESSDGVHGGYCSSTRLCTRGGGAVRDRSAGGSVRGIS